MNNERKLKRKEGMHLWMQRNWYAAQKFNWKQSSRSNVDSNDWLSERGRVGEREGWCLHSPNCFISKGTKDASTVWTASFSQKNLCVLHPPRKIITVAVAYTDQSIHLHSSFASHKVRNRRVRKFWENMINYWAYLWWWLQDVVGCFHNFTMINGG